MVVTAYRADRTLIQEGRTYRWVTNVRSGSHDHKIWQDLVEEGLSVTFQEKAYNSDGRLLKDLVSVFVAKEEALNVYEAFNLKQAHYWSKRGWPEATFDFLKGSGADEETEREVLATAYDTAAGRLNWRGKGSDNKRDVALAKNMWRFAAKLREGQVRFRLLTEDRPIEK